MHLVVFLLSGRGDLSVFTDTQSTTEKVEEKKKQTNTDLGPLQAQKLGEVYVILFCKSCVSVSWYERVHVRKLSQIH